MKNLEKDMIKRASELLGGGQVDRVLGWKKGEFYSDPSPAVFNSTEELKDFVYNAFCGANLSKYLIELNKDGKKTAVFLKPCDGYSLNQLLKENRVKRDNVYVIAIGCQGKLDGYKISDLGVDGVLDADYYNDKVVISALYGEKTIDKKDVLLEKCLTCKGKTPVIFDEELGTELSKDTTVYQRFSKVSEIESMTEEERFAFWRSELSKCIRCNACRNVCPACSCVKCVFDNGYSGISAKANDTDFEEKLYHIIRAFHVAGRCTDCGECSRVCPQRIPLHLINRKFIKDANELYGEFQAGESSEGKTPLTSYSTDDAEPNEAVTRGDK